MVIRIITWASFLTRITWHRHHAKYCCWFIFGFLSVCHYQFPCICLSPCNTLGPYSIYHLWIGQFNAVWAMLCACHVYMGEERRTSTFWAHLQSSDSTLLMMSARSKGSGMLGSSTPQKGRSTGASSGGNVWARFEWHLRRQDTGNKHTRQLHPPIKS